MISVLRISDLSCDKSSFNNVKVIFELALILSGYTRFFVNNAFLTQPQCCLTFS